MPTLRFTGSIGAIAFVATIAAAFAAERPAPSSVDEPSVAGARLGRVLLGELGCLSCHHASSNRLARLGLMPKSAPHLRDIGEWASAEWLMRYLAAPRRVMPGTTMPDVLHGIPDRQRAVAAEALTHYLLSLARSAFRRTLPDRAAVIRGDALFHQIGCVACHAPQKAATAMGSAAPLPNMAEKWSSDGLRRFLLNPLASRPSGRMPGMALSDGEATDLAQYLVRETRVPAPLEVAQYRGHWRSLDDLASSELVRTGPADSFDVTDRSGGLRFHGWLEIGRAGDFTIFHQAAGASRLALDGSWLAGDDGWRRGRVEAKHTLPLAAGWHEIVLEFVPRGPGPPALRVEWEGPGLSRQIIPASRLRSEREPPPEPAALSVDSDKAAIGRKLFVDLQCAACHEEKASPAGPAPALMALKGSGGCLAETPPAGAPDYRLDRGQVAALRAALASLREAEAWPLPPAQRLMNALTTFRCTACHARDGVGGVSADRDAWFTSNGEDLGEEGRLPPRLDGVGDKLRRSWLGEVLARGVRVRPYLNTRMPQFGADIVGLLADLFVTLDRRAGPVPVAPDPPERQRDAGRQLVGTDGLSCIACHRFNRQPAHAMQVIDLTTTAERLNEDWFRRFLLDPNRYNPGTRMPSLWPEGVSPLPGLLDGNVDRQYAALWRYLADGSRARTPEGLSRQSLELVVGGEAVVYRGKLWEAGFRAVAVGYPGQINAAFDAEELRLALLWRGRFLNAGPHWGVQGMGRIRPLGNDVVIFPHGSALALLRDARTPWPPAAARELGGKFRGYQLDKLQRPTLLYSFGSMDVEDFLTEAGPETKPWAHRTLRFAGATPAGLHLRLAVGRLTPGAPNTWRLEDQLTIRLPAGAVALVRGEDDRQELLVPVGFRDGRSLVEVDYVW